MLSFPVVGVGVRAPLNVLDWQETHFLKSMVRDGPQPPIPRPLASMSGAIADKGVIGPIGGDSPVQ